MPVEALSEADLDGLEQSTIPEETKKRLWERMAAKALLP
jgi:hypothetical protein